MNRQLDARWLREICRDVARDPLPDLDWERIGQGVFQSLESPSRTIPLRPAAPIWPRLAAVAAVAALAAGLVLSVSPSSPPVALQATPTLPVVQARELTPNPDGFHTPQRGVEFVTHESALTFNHEGWALFRLHPGGRLQISRLDDRVELNLVQGGIDATIHKHSAEEVFTVRVGNLRAAVHGTVFSIERRDSTMHVEVHQGSVAVGPAARHGTTEGWLVTAPSSGLFDFERPDRLSTRSIVARPIVIEPMPGVAKVEPAVAAAESMESEEAEQRKAAPAAQPQPKPSVEAVLENPSLPEKLTPSLAASTLQSLARQIQTCHHNAVPKRNDGVTIRASTTVTIHVAPDGHVVFARFDPPLSPAAQSCASKAVQSARFPAARVESQLTLPVSM